MEIYFTNEQYAKIQQLIDNMNSYYEDVDALWSFEDVDSQREIGKEIVEMLEYCITTKNR